ncbi:MAG TPA: hypothetical protein VMM92_13860 [Thermoanaerobaculia bacterium]|nr:hypothetical protein [Thermoanaerobaculia bacterium]
MARPFLTNDAKKAFTEAVHAVEGACSAELMIAVRRQSGSYLDGALTVALAVGLATLAILLFFPKDFGLAWFLLDPVILGLLAALAATRSPALLRLATSRASRRRKVGTAARSAFVEKGIHRTHRRTGILLYISLLEREAELVTDFGIDPALETPEWRAVTAAIQEDVRRGADGLAVAARVRGLAAVLAPVCAHVEGQVNELPDEVCE